MWTPIQIYLNIYTMPIWLYPWTYTQRFVCGILLKQSMSDHMHLYINPLFFGGGVIKVFGFAISELTLIKQNFSYEKNLMYEHWSIFQVEVGY